LVRLMQRAVNVSIAFINVSVIGYRPRGMMTS
jgi:hypothetical protein